MPSVVVKSDPTPPRKNKQPPQLFWPRAFGVCKMSDEKAAALAEWLHTTRKGRKANEIKPTFTPVAVLPLPNSMKK